MISKSTLDLLTLVAYWFAAIGTNAAVMVALWLAYRQNRGRIRVTASIVRLIEMGAKVADGPQYFSVAATNAGARDTVVTGIQWTIGWFSKKHLVQLPNVDALNPRLPIKLSPGETATFLFPIAMFEANMGRIASAWHGSRFARLRRSRIRVGVYTSLGEAHLVCPDTSVLKLLKSAAPAP